MNDLITFDNSRFGTIRAIEKDGEPWFIASDVCRSLELEDVNKAISRLDDDEGTRIEIPHPQNPEKRMTVNAVNEPGLYSLILGSRKPEAKAFKRWITHDVIPSIRKTGAYSAKADQTSADKAALAEAKLNNSRARLASEWRKLAEKNPVPEYRQICDHYASAALAGKVVLPLPEVGERTYTAEEVGGILGISANKVGRIANENRLKTPEYGVEVWDKAKFSAKQVPAWRYNCKAVDRLREILNS